MTAALHVVDKEFDLSLGLAEAADEARLERLEDANRAEIAACRSAKARTIRKSIADCTDLDAQIAALESRKASIKRTAAAKVSVFERRIRGAEAYLAAIAEAPVEMKEAAE